MEKSMETTIMGYIGTIIRINSFIPCESCWNFLAFLLPDSVSPLGDVRLQPFGFRVLWV